MNDFDESPSLSRRHQLVLTAIILVVVVIESADVFGDVAEGSTLGHVALETTGIILGLAGIAWIWLQNLRLEARRVDLTKRLASAHAEAEGWRLKSQEFMQGLGRVIDEQFGAWGLSAAEKDVALLLLKGLSLKEISEVRGTAERTTRQQAQEAYRKSGLAGRAEFAAFFLEDLLLPNSSWRGGA